MNQVLYILLGWVLGLFSPLIVEYFRSHVRKREFVRALKVELEELQHRLAVSSLSLLQSYGELARRLHHGLCSSLIAVQAMMRPNIFESFCVSFWMQTMR